MPELAFLGTNQSHRQSFKPTTSTRHFEMGHHLGFSPSPSPRRFWALCAMVIPLLSSALAEEDPNKAEPRYRLKSDVTGSAIRDTAATANAYPVDRPYSKFTENEKAALRAEYENMPDSDEPPFPERGLKAVIEPLSKLITRLRLEGNVTIIVTVDAQGAATDVALVKYPDLETAKAVAAVLFETKYKPAVCGGQPCRMQWAFRTILRPR
jgi:hypothetical protein